MASILIVDDDQNILFLLSEVLTRENHQITKATDGSEAIQILRHEKFDLVISDLHMKQVNGIEVLQFVKEQKLDHEVLILTGYGTVNSAVKAMKLGAFEYLTKPLNIEELRLKVNQAILQREMKLKVAFQEKKIRAHQEMLERDLKLAETVQQTLIPRPLENEKIAVYVNHYPIIGVGGDFADIYFRADNLVYCTIVDVTGHGIAAALIVNRVCSEIRKFVREQEDEPKDILFHLNNFIVDSFYRTGLFLTSFSYLIDLKTSKLHYTGCAHPPLIFWNSSRRQIELLESQNTIIGFQKSEQNTFVQNTRSIAKGDRFFLYTDGIVEAENQDGQLYGVAGLTTSFEKCLTLPIHQVNSAMKQSMETFRDKPLRDDIYLLVSEVR